MIPKIIHQIWITFNPNECKKFEDNELFKIQNERTINFCKKNDIKYLLHNDEECEKLLSKYPEHIDFYNNLRYPTQKCDFLRYLIIYEYGGLYLDMDVSPVRDLNDIWNEKVFLVRWNDTPNIPYTAVMACEKNSNFFKEVIEHFYESYESKKDMDYYKKWKGKFVFHTSAHHMINRVLKKQEEKIKLSDVMDISKKNRRVKSDNPMFLDYNANSWNVKKTCQEMIKK
jgi:inositol phosphorylceramide mannosyltransferase catalytic subunit